LESDWLKIFREAASRREIRNPSQSPVDCDAPQQRLSYFTYGLLKRGCASIIRKEESDVRMVMVGLSYKGNVKDYGGSSSVVDKKILEREGMRKVMVYDPLFSSEELEKLQLTPSNPVREQGGVPSKSSPS
jgi:hypothetical protein